MSSPTQKRVLMVHGVPAGVGGLGMHVAQVLRALAPASVLLSAGPADTMTAHPGAITYAAPRAVPRWARRFTPLRSYQGVSQWISDRAVGVWAAMLAGRERPDLVYSFTQVGFEVLEWAKATGIPSILDNPNGHIADHREVCAAEARKWCGRSWRGHPATAMVERVEKEYALADRIRVASDWAKYSMVERGIPAGKIEVIPHEVDSRKFQLSERQPTDGPLRVAFTSALSLGKGLAYLLRAIRAAGPERFSLVVTAQTGDRCAKEVFERESKGLSIIRVDHPKFAYDAAEVAVTPSLHDGFGLVIAEAMASGLPVIVSERCGAAEWMREVEPRWIIPAADERALERALLDALARRESLPKMGRAARDVAERRGSDANLRRLAWWALQRHP